MRYPSGEHQIHEVYYLRDGNLAWHENASSPYCAPGEPVVTGMLDQLDMMREALNKPVLDYETGDPV